ncbi:MAG TPA: cyclic nucleotide-binding domain-containing protein [bacterium]|nr:cyclic nucleotide-binding domain-containing protein [bacterium]HPQ71995.1 cyclic nucleotide-binding domain-containing protein [bacterium]
MDIAQHPFISRFSPKGRTRLVSEAQVVDLPAGKVLFREEDPADSLCLVLEGTVEIFKTPAPDRVETLSRMGPGEFFGEMGVLDEAPRSAGARAAEDSVIALVPAKVFQYVLREEPSAVALEVVGRMSQRLREANIRLMKKIT